MIPDLNELETAAPARLDELLDDPRFLIGADPDRLLRALTRTASSKARQVTAVYRVSGAAAALTTTERARGLALGAAALGLLDLQRALIGELHGRWAPMWTHTAGRPHQQLVGHTSRVNAVAVGRAGDRDLIVAGGDDAVRIWDANTGCRVGEALTGHLTDPYTGTAAVNAVAIGRIGGRDIIVSGGNDHTVRLWDARTGQPIKEPLAGDDSAVAAVAIGRAGDRDIIVSVDLTKSIRVWDAVTGQQAASPVSCEWAWTVATGMIAGRDVIVSGGIDGRVRVLDAQTMQTVWERTLAGDSETVYSVAMGRIGDQDVIVSGGLKSVLIRDAMTGEPAGNTLPNEWVNAVAIGHTSGRDFIATGSQDGTVRIWDAATHLPVGGALTGHTGAVTAVAVGAAGSRDIVASAGADGSVRIWDADLEPPAWDQLAGHSGLVNAVAAGRHGDREVIVSGGNDGAVRVWDAQTGRPLRDPLLGHTGDPVRMGDRPLAGNCVTGIALGRAIDRDVIVSAGNDGTVRVWDASTGQQIGDPLTGHINPWISAVATARAGNRDIIASAGLDRVLVWDASTGQQIGDPLARPGGEVHAVAVGQAGRRDVIVSGGNDGAVRVWDARTGRPVRSPPTGHTGPVRAVAVGKTASRDVIVSGGDDATVRVWEARTGRPAGIALTGHTGAVTAVAVGQISGHDVIVSGGADHTVRVWDAAGTAEVLPVLGAVTAIAVSSRQLVVAAGMTIAAFSIPSAASRSR